MRRERSLGEWIIMVIRPADAHGHEVMVTAQRILGVLTSLPSL